MAFAAGMIDTFHHEGTRWESQRVLAHGMEGQLAGVRDH